MHAIAICSSNNIFDLQLINFSFKFIKKYVLNWVQTKICVQPDRKKQFIISSKFV